MYFAVNNADEYNYNGCKLTIIMRLEVHIYFKRSVCKDVVVLLLKLVTSIPTDFIGKLLRIL